MEYAAGPETQTKKRRLSGGRLVLTIIAAVLAWSLTLTGIGFPLYLKVPNYLMEQGDYVTAYRIATDSTKKGWILTEFMIIAVLSEKANNLYYPSSLEVVGAYLAIVENYMTVMCQYKALNKSETQVMSYTGAIVNLSAVTGTTSLGFLDDESAEKLYYTVRNSAENARIIQTSEALDRINKHCADEHLLSIALTWDDFWAVAGS
jgi:hypothetical protein